MYLEIKYSIGLLFACNGNPSFIFKILYYDHNRIYFNAYEKKNMIQIMGDTQSYYINLFEGYFDSDYFYFDDKSKLLYNNRLRKIKIKRLNDYK